MEIEIEEKLQEIYQNLYIEVHFIDFRLYEIVTKIETNPIGIFESKIRYKYKADKTIDYNIMLIENIIDNEILLPFFKNKI